MLATFDDLIAELRSVDGLVAKGKTGQNFYVRSKPFLHFHGGAEGTYADVRFGADWERVPVGTAGERHELVRRVRAYLDSLPRRE